MASLVPDKMRRQQRRLCKRTPTLNLAWVWLAKIWSWYPVWGTTSKLPLQPSYWILYCSDPRQCYWEKSVTYARVFKALYVLFHILLTSFAYERGEAAEYSAQNLQITCPLTGDSFFSLWCKWRWWQLWGWMKWPVLLVGPRTKRCLRSRHSPSSS